MQKNILKITMNNKIQKIPTTFSLQKTILLLSLLLLLPAFGFATEKSYIVGYHKHPGKAEKERIKQSKGQIKRSFKLIKAMSVTLSEDEVVKLKKIKILPISQKTGFTPQQNRNRAMSMESPGELSIYPLILLT